MTDFRMGVDEVCAQKPGPRCSLAELRGMYDLLVRVVNRLNEFGTALVDEVPRAL